MEGESKKGEMADIKPYVARIERVETALSVKFDVLTARVDKMDDKLSNVIRDVEKNRKVVNNIKQTAVPQPAQNVERAVVKSTAQDKVPNKSENTTKTATAKKMAANTKSETKSVSATTQSKQQKAGSQGGVTYHTVAKGDTLYNISKKYETTVDNLRAINKMTTKDSIVIGQRIIVKK